MIARWGRAWLVVCALGSGCRQDAVDLPVLLVAAADSERDEQGSESVEARAALLALRSMNGPRLAQLAERIEDITTRLEGSSSPLGVDLGDGDPRRDLRHMVAEYLPSITAARSLARGRWKAGSWVASLSARCPSGAAEQCISLSGRRETDRQHTLRFAAWPVTRALFVNRPGSDPLQRLRAHVVRPMGNVALVLTHTDLAARRRGVEREIVTTASRLAHLLTRDGASEFGYLAQWGDPIVGDSLLPQLPLAPSKVLVVPRMGALARLSEFRDEVEAELDPGR